MLMADIHKEKTFFAGVRELFRRVFGNEADRDDGKDRAIAMGRISHLVAIALWEMSEGNVAMEGDEVSVQSVFTDYPWLIDLYVDEGDMYAIVAHMARLYRVPVTVNESDVTLGQPEEVVEAFEAVSDNERTVSVIRQKDGRYRWVNISATATLNRNGEIDSRALFDSFVDHIERTGEYPVLNFFHTGLTLGQSDFVARDGYCYITSGLFDDTPIGNAAARGVSKEPEYWGNSIEFSAFDYEMAEIAEDVRVPVYKRGVNPAIALLPEQDAAHLMTGYIAVTQREVGMKASVKDAIGRLFGDEDEELAAQVNEQLEGAVDQRNRNIEEGNMIARSTDDVEAEAEDAEAITDDETDAEDGETEAEMTEHEIVLDEEMLETLGDLVADRLQARQQETYAEILRGISEAVESLEGSVANIQEATNGAIEHINQRLAALEVDETERVREIVQDLPASPRSRVIFRPSNRVERSAEGDDTPVTSDELAQEALSKLPHYRGV